jgi:kanosamine 6-kinase
MDLLGIDIGGTKLALRVVGDGGERQWAFRWPDAGSKSEPGSGSESAESDSDSGSGKGDAGADLELLADALSEVRGGSRDGFAAVGVSVAATLDGGGRVTSWPNRPHWIGVELGAAFARLLPGVPLEWADDGELAGLAEASAAGLPDLVYLGVGTGIGGAVIGGPRGARNPAELGHVIVDRSGPRCVCGRRGCLQAVASGRASLDRAARVTGAPAVVTFDRLRRAWSARESWAVEVVSESRDALAAAVVSVHEILHPTAFVIGGGFAAGLDGFVSAVAEHAAPLGRTGHQAPLILPARLGADSSAHGAVLLARSLLLAQTGQDSAHH